VDESWFSGYFSFYQLYLSTVFINFVFATPFSCKARHYAIRMSLRLTVAKHDKRVSDAQIDVWCWWSNSEILILIILFSTATTTLSMSVFCELLKDRVPHESWCTRSGSMNQYYLLTCLIRGWHGDTNLTPSTPRILKIMPISTPHSSFSPHIIPVPVTLLPVPTRPYKLQRSPSDIFFTIVWQKILNWITKIIILTTNDMQNTTKNNKI